MFSLVTLCLVSSVLNIKVNSFTSLPQFSRTRDTRINQRQHATTFTTDTSTSDSKVEQRLMSLDTAPEKRSEEKRLTNIVLDIKDEQDLNLFLNSNPNTLLVLKFYAPYCKSCKALGPLYKHLAHDTTYSKLPIVFSEMNSRPNMDFIKEIGIIAFPTVSVYRGGTAAGAEGLKHTQMCGPAKFKDFKKTLYDVVTDTFDEEMKALYLHEEDIPVSKVEGAKDVVLAVAEEENDDDVNALHMLEVMQQVTSAMQQVSSDNKARGSVNHPESEGDVLKA